MIVLERPVAYTMSAPQETPDFGKWLKSVLDAANVKYTVFAKAADIAYPNLLAYFRPGKNGKPIQPEKPTITRILNVMLELKLINDASAGWSAAGYTPDGFRLVSSGPEIIYEPDPYIQEIGESIQGKPDSFKQSVVDYTKQLEQIWLTAQREGAIGRRANDESE